MNVLARIAKGGMVLCLVAGVGVAAAWWGPGLYQQWFPDRGASSGVSDVRFHTVARGKLKVALVEDGHLRAVKHHKIATELNGRARIAWIIPQGAQVKKGDKLVEFEKKPIEELITQREGELEAAKREQIMSEESLKIEDSSGRSMLAAAETHLKESKDALKKYRELEAPQQLKTLEATTSQAREKLLKAQQDLVAAQTKADEQLFVDDEQKKNLQSQLAAAKDGVKGARKAVEAALLQQKMFKAYDYPRMLESKKVAVANAELDLAKSQIAAKSQLLQKESSLGQIKDRIKRLTRDLEEQNKELSKCLIVSPIDGIVLYGDPQQRGMMRYGGGDNEIKVGAETYRNNTLLTIPDLSAFEADISVSEEYRGRLKPACKATVMIEAVPGLVLEGTLKEISPLARPRIPWDESSPKVFDGIIELKVADPRMVSGMSTRVEIVTETAENVLLVPIESVFNEDGQTVCYVRDGAGFEKRRVKTARSNDNFVEIAEGVAEGDQVYTFNPSEGQQSAGPAKAVPAP